MQSQTFIFFGQVGSGKGTQVKLLIDFLKEKTGMLSTYAYPGNEYRKLVASGNYTGDLIKDSLNKGELQPNFLTNTLFTNILIDSLDDTKHFVADGYPRTTVQSEVFEQIMKFYKRDDIHIVYIELSEEEAMKRNLLRGRSDDTEEGLRRRFNEYLNNVVPAMNYFVDKSGYTLHTINGEQSIEAVHQDIIKALNL